ncbi:MAG: hypothetical protein EBU46_00950 [Nitrosomonadaceae bacterium]|nr:hypothetical protein [Nitrosomonadaceae bacterium]
MTNKQLGFVKAAMSMGYNEHQAVQFLKVANFPPHQDPHGAPTQHQGPPQQQPGGMGGGQSPHQHGGGAEPTVTVDGQPLPPELAKMVLQILEQVAGGGHPGGAQPGQHPGM